MKGNFAGKFKKGLAGIIAATMVVTLMPMSAFADTATADDVSCVVTLKDSSQTITLDSISDAINAVNDGGSITVTGTINNAINLNVTGKTYTLDISGATWGIDKSVTAGENACLGSDEDQAAGIYKYHDAHKYTSAQAVGSNTNTSDVMVYCEYGGSILKTDVVGDADTTTKPGYTIYTATIPEVAADYTVTWEVKDEEAATTYALKAGTQDYVSYTLNNDKIAVADANGKLQFFANYQITKGGATTDAEEKLWGTYTDADVTNPVEASTTSYGKADYNVTFTFPDGTTEKYTYSEVINAPKKPAADATTEVAGIRYKTLKTEGETTKEDWSNEIALGSATTATVNLTNPLLASDGSITYCLTYVADEAGAANVNGEEKTFAPTSVETKDCGYAKYTYGSKISETYAKNGNIVTVEFSVNPYEAEGTHEYETRETWAKSFTIGTPAGHKNPGAATAICKFCGKENINVVIPTTGHTFVKDSTGAEEIVTVPADCQTLGFQYKKCSVGMSGSAPDYAWTSASGVYTMTIQDEKNRDLTVSVTADAAPEWHPVYVEGSVKEKTDHSLYVVADSIQWEEDATLAGKATTNDVTVNLQKKCMYEAGSAAAYKYVYHKAEFPTTIPAGYTVVEDMEDTLKDSTGCYHVYDAITETVEEGETCEKGDVFTYTVNGVLDPAGKAITKTVTSTKYFGPHNYKNTVTFSADGKSATVVQQCQNTYTVADGATAHVDRIDLDGNKATQKKDAVVTSVDNADGSTTYTATVEGLELTDNTKTLFDLTKAVVTINDGNDVDINTLGTTDKATAFNKLVVVTINGATIDSKLYKTSANEDDFADKNDKYEITISSTEENFYGTIKATTKLIKPDTFTANAATLDGKAIVNGEEEIDYDGAAHPVAVTAYKTGDANKVTVDAAIKYAVSDTEYTDEEKIAALTFDLDTVELTDVNLDAAGDEVPYYVYAEISKDGFTTAYELIAAITIYKKSAPDGGSYKITTKVKTMVYGDTGLTATTGDVEIDEAIGLTTIESSTLGAGTYQLSELVSYDATNYDVNVPYSQVVIEKRNATIVMTEGSSTYDGLPVDLGDLFTIDGAVNGDTLDVVVNTAGNKEIIDAGDYTLVATANDANYNIEKVTATYTVNPASIAKAKVTLAKTSMKYTGKALKPAVKSVVLDGETLAASNYTVKYANNKNVGTATVTVTGKGNYTGSAKATFKITKATQKVKSVSPTKKTVKAGASFKITAKATKEQGTAQFKKTSGNAGITISSAGKVTVKKTVKAGKYTIKYKVRIKATKNCKATSYVSKKVVVTVK